MFHEILTNSMHSLVNEESKLERADIVKEQTLFNPARFTVGQDTSLSHDHLYNCKLA